MLKRLGELVVAYRWGATPLETTTRDEPCASWNGWRTISPSSGMREYRFVETEGRSAYDIEPLGETGLRILRDPEVRVLTRRREPQRSQIRQRLARSRADDGDDLNIRSRIHRQIHMDYIGVKLWGDGRMCGELRILGLFTASAYTRSVHDVPMVRRRWRGWWREPGCQPAVIRRMRSPTCSRPIRAAS